MEKNDPPATSKVHSQQVRGQQLCWKDLGWCHPVPHPYYAWDYVQTTRWPRASEGRPHPVFSCLTGGIKEGSELPRVRTRGHRHKPARGKFLLEVRKDFSPWGCSNVLRLSRKTAESPWHWGDAKLEWAEPRANWSASTCSELGAG